MTPQSANAGIDDLAAAVRTAQDEMLVAVQRGGLVNDPLRYVLSAVSAGLGAIFEIFGSPRVPSTTGMSRVKSIAKQVDAVARAQLEIEQKEAQSIHAIAGAIASAAEQALTRPRSPA